MSFNEAASGIREFKAQKQALAKELSEIVGFDIYAINTANPKEETHVKLSLLDTTYTKHVALQNPLSFALHIEIPGWRSWLFDAGPTNTVFFKKDNEFHVCTRNFNISDPVSDEDIRSIFANKFMLAGIDMGDLENLCENNPSAPSCDNDPV